MKLEFSKNILTVVREKGDPRFYGIKHGKGESRLLHQIKMKLNKLGYDLIKKRMCKDGHLTDQYQQYLRSRKIKKGAKNICIHNHMFAIRGAEEDFNNEGKVELMINCI